MWLTDLVAPRHVGSSQTRARTHVSCIGRQILNHCATREALVLIFMLPCAQREVRPSAEMGSWAGESRRKKGFEKGVKILGSHCRERNTREDRDSAEAEIF